VRQQIKENSKYFLCVKWKIVRVTDARLKDKERKKIQKGNVKTKILAN
jgi:hypothetical protein